MSYFSNFPYTSYEIDGKSYIIKDIFRQAAFVSEYKPISALYENYTILDGETPHSISEKFYGSSSYYWVILVFNNIHSMYKDWPLDQNTLQQVCEEKYGQYVYSIKHYEERFDHYTKRKYKTPIISGGGSGEIKEFSIPWVAPTSGPTGSAVAVSFYEYESQLNDEKRNIQLLKPTLIGEFTNQFKRLINE